MSKNTLFLNQSTPNTTFLRIPPSAVSRSNSITIITIIIEYKRSIHIYL